MFLAGTVWNLLGGTVVVVGTPWIFSYSNLTPPHPPAYYYSWIALFLTFGIGYYMVYLDPYANKNLVILGIIGKLGFAGVFLWNYLAFPGTVPVLFWIPLVGDLVFVGLYWMFLSFARKMGR